MSTQAFSKRNVTIAFWLVTTLFFLWGLSYGLIDVMNKNFQNQLGITKATSGFLQAAYFGGYFVIATPAALVARKWGFKGGIIMGLVLYAIGCLLIIPASNLASFQVFLIAFFILACGLGSLETNANPYITKLGDDKDASFRINMAQIFNGVGQFLGPIIGGQLLLTLTHPGAIEENMRNVQMVYVGIAAIIAVMIVLFLVNRLPEGSEVSGVEEAPDAEEGNVYSRLLSYRHFRRGVVAQFLYVGSQVGAGAFFINYAVEHWNTLADETAAYYLSVALVAFMVGRVVTTPLMKKWKSSTLLGVYSLINVCIMVLLNLVTGMPSVMLLIACFFFMSISFPTIFALSVTNLPDSLVKTASSLLIMSIVGGAIMPFVMGSIADAYGTGVSFLINIPCFLFVAWYGFVGYKEA